MCSHPSTPDQQLQTVPGCLLGRSGELQLRLLPGLLIPGPAKAQEPRCRPPAQDGHGAGCLVRVNLRTGGSSRRAGSHAAQRHDWTETEHHDVNSAVDCRVGLTATKPWWNITEYIHLRTVQS